jgi:general secretion pathway protein D
LGANDGLSTGPNYPPLYGQNWGNPSLGPPLTPAVRLPLGMENSPQQLTSPNGTPETQGSTESDASSNAVNDLIGEAKVTVDIHTNSIIVLAKPEVQRFYATLIDELDKRRPQVLVEAKVVIIDTTDDFSLGVEVSGGGRNGLERLFAFTSYGFSQVNPVNGALQIVPGVGFNGTLVDPNTADVVVRALSSHRRARVLSAPRILVNDNAEGELSSVLEVPFTSVNASQTVATTSFAGFAQAGTTINVTPTISEDNYLQLDYSVTLNSFTGDGSQGVPPPRQTNEVRSRVSVPDGYTVIVGGLTNKNDSQQYRGLPWLELVPVVRELTGATSNSWKQTSLFVFLRPVILRDDKFKDLKYVSDYDMSAAGLETEFPDSQPELIR